MPDSTITLRTRADLAALVATRNSFNVLTSEEQKAERAALSLAQSMATLDAKMGQPAAGAARLKAALQNATYIDPKQGTAALNQIITLEQKAAAEAAKLGKTANGIQILPRSLENFGPQALNQIKSGLLGIVGPAALVTAGFSAVRGAIDLTEESFKLSAALETTNKSISVQLQSFRNVGQALRDGQAFAQRYKITQVENAEAIQASIPILRTSKASLTDVESVLARLSVLKPAQGIQGAAFALGELEGGQSRSLNTRFNIPLTKANELRDAIRKGGDAVQIVGKYLDSVGVGMNTLDIRTQGATGKMNELKVETEQFQLALSGQAGGPGLALLNARIDFTRGATRLLSGEFDQFARSVNASIASGQTGLLSFLNILQPLAQQAEQAAQQADAAMALLTARQLAAVAASERKSAVDDVLTTGTKRVTIATAESNEAVAKLTADINDNADKSALDAATKNLQSAATAKVAFETKNAADAFIKLNPNLDASEGFAKAAAVGLDPLVQQVIALRIEADKTRAALLGEKLNGQTARQLTGADSDQGELRSGLRQSKLAGRAAGIAKAQADATASGQAYANQIIQTGTAAQVVAERQKEYNEAVRLFGKDSAQAIDAQTARIKARQVADKPGKGPKGLSATDRADVNLTNDLNAQLTILLDKQKGLKAGSLAWKQAQGEILDIQKKIADQQDRARDAQLDVKIATIEDRKARREEANQLAGAQRRLASGEFNAEEKAGAQDEAELIPLKQEKRTRDIAAKAREAGVAVPGAAAQPNPFTPAAGAAAPQPGGAPPAPAAPATADSVIIIEVDGKEIGRVAARYLSNGRNAAALRG